MKIIVLHGDHYLDSYARLDKFIDIAKSRGWEIQRISDISKNLQEVLISDSLFQKEKLVIVEDVNLISKKFVQWLNKKEEDLNVNLVIYHKGLLNKTFLKSFPTAKIEEFKMPRLLWRFLDSIYPGNAKLAISIFREVLKKEPIEFTFAMISRHLKDLYWTKLSSNLPYPSWKVTKLKHQASRFNETQIKEIISEFADADLKSKTSQENLSDLLAFLIATKLE